MIARKIVYKGQFDNITADTVYDIVRKIAVTGEIKQQNNAQLTLELEGDPSMIKLIQHQIERRIKGRISDKAVDTIPYRHYTHLSFGRI